MKRLPPVLGLLPLILIGGCQTTELVLKEINIDDLGPAPQNDTIPDGVMYRGVNKEQWDTIAKYGDPLNCRKRVKEFQGKSGGRVLTSKECANDPNCISAALRWVTGWTWIRGERISTFWKKDNPLVVLREGTYKINETIKINHNQVLMGASGAKVIIDASGVKTAVELRGGTLANLTIQHAENVGVRFRRNSLAYRVVVGNTGVNRNWKNSDGSGFLQNDYSSYSRNRSTQNVTGNCLVSVEAYNGYNETGSSAGVINGGNADGISVKFGASNSTIIDAHAHHNSDDGFDFWKGGQDLPSPTIRVFYSSANHNGKDNGDGNGYKFGSGSGDKGSRLIHGSAACKNKNNGFDRNSTSMDIHGFTCNASGNWHEDIYEMSCSHKVDKYALDCSMFD